MCGEIAHSFTQEFKKNGLALESLIDTSLMSPMGEPNISALLVSSVEREYIQDPLLGLPVFAD